MGRNKRRGDSKRDGGKQVRRPAENWDDIPQDNAAFLKYYQSIKVVADDEWSSFLDYLRRPLPTTFRVTASRLTAHAVQDLIQDKFVPHLSGLEWEGEPLEPPSKLPWYPDGFAWQLRVNKQQIRRNEKFREFQSFLVHETEVGNISRQEAVSMLPPLLLDVKPHHKALDMCAAPGSKTAQLLEALQRPSALDTAGFTTTSEAGLLVANDSDQKRCHMLIHQTLQRIPAANMMVTNCDAAGLPGMREQLAGSSKTAPLRFDRILADVPCTGDGTLRKNPMIWRTWTVRNAQGLHSLQLRILKRGIQLLKPGGRLVYSTCSMNPLENEAVVSAALEEYPSMSLVPVEDKLPHLVYRPGLTDWPVLGDDGEPIDRKAQEDAAQQSSKGKSARKPVSPTCWPNGKEEERGLSRCMRLYPHLQDTGGFFVALLEKRDQPPRLPKRGRSPSSTAESTSKKPRNDGEAATAETSEVSTPVADRGDDSVGEEAADSARGGEEEDAADVDVDAPAEVVGDLSKSSSKSKETEEAFVFLPADHAEIKNCIDFFELSDQFPAGQLLVRNPAGDAVRGMLVASPSAKAIVDATPYKKIRLLSCGVKIFQRQNEIKGEPLVCRWRIASEGVEVLRPFMGPGRIAQIDATNFRHLMANINVSLDSLELGAFRDRIESMPQGSLIVEAHMPFNGSDKEQKIMCPVYKARSSCALMVEKLERAALSFRLYGEDVTPFAANANARAQRRQAPPADEDASRSIDTSEQGPPSGVIVAEDDAPEPTG